MSTPDRETIFRDCHRWIETATYLGSQSFAFDKLAAYESATEEQLPVDYLRGAYRLATGTYSHDGPETKWLVFSSHIRYLIGGSAHRGILHPGV